MAAAGRAAERPNGSGQLAIDPGSGRVERERLELALSALEDRHPSAALGACRSVFAHDGVRPC